MDYIQIFPPFFLQQFQRNPKVVEGMKDVLRFWLGKGVSGFRVDAIPTLFEVAPDARGNLPDEPKSGKCDDPDDYCYLNHTFTYDLDETFSMVYQWRELLEEHQKENGGDSPVLMTEAYSELDSIIRYYGDGKRNGAHIPFNFHLLANTNKASKAADYKNLIEAFLSKVPAGSEANWVVRIIYTA